MAGVLSVRGEVDDFTINVNAGERVYLRVADTETTPTFTSPFFPRVSLFDPSGERVTLGAGELVGDIERSLTIPGQYTVAVDDNRGLNEGSRSYNLYYAKGGADDDGVLPNGGVVSGLIDLGDLDSYSFTAQAGETIFLRVADPEATSLFPNIELLDPSGEHVVGSEVARPLVGTLSRSLDQSGTYTVIVNDESTGEDATGSYDLYFAKAPGANDDGRLLNGGLVSDTIELGDIDSYTFVANAGEVAYLRVADTGVTEFLPTVILLDPTGEQIRSNSNTLVGDIRQSLSMSGTYTVLIVAGDTDATGTYDLYFAKPPGASDDGCIADGQSIDRFIDLGDIDSYTFRADAGTSFTVTVTDLDGASLSPLVSLYGPSGEFVTSRSGVNSATINRVLEANGDHTLIVADESPGEDATGNYRISISGTSVRCLAPRCNGLPVSVFIGNGDLPTGGADVILGTSGADVINALSGNDTICALGGNDIVNGGSGNDWIDGGAGNDELRGNGGADEIFGDTGDDIIRGGGSNDKIFGEDGDDTLFGQSGEDDIDGGNGIDDINGGGGRDTLSSGSGATVGTGKLVFGGSGADTITGGPDADDLRGGNGNDIINGFSGDDFITGGQGQDTVNGGGGADTIIGNNSRDTLSGGSGNDVIEGGSQSDILNGGGGSDIITGGSGNDELNGDGGSDTLFGGADNDDLDGGASSGDECNGQSGTDTATADCEVISTVP